MNTKVATNTVISVRTNKNLGDRLSRLAKITNRSRSMLIGEALEQYVAHQDWLVTEIERGITAAEKGELVSDDAVATWIKSLT
ncbi:MAG: CopG family ribbon-helix-helix protein [Candidatus Pacebacteria bacterium]|jgi:RHH-type rel operon transcriptional repressor/antitoxin RelB|nr:CopG family ribbon-helix-helix protein [Candidatus Paceibacterota bacterium]